MEKIGSPNTSDNQKVTFESLPDIVLGKIMSYLHWKEKQLLAIASNRINLLLNSPLAWESFENNRDYALKNLNKFMQFAFLMDQEIEVIRLYGKYFQRCKVWLHFTDTTLVSNSIKHKETIILSTVSTHCKHLKWLCIVHPSGATFSNLQRCHDYIDSIQNIVLGQTRVCFLSLRNLFYLSLDFSVSVIRNYIILLARADLLQNVKCLDVSHGRVSDKTCRPVAELGLFSNLTVLKCPLHAVNKSILLNLCHQSLVSLYLINDEHTSKIVFKEDSSLDWPDIELKMSLTKRNVFEIHYIFQNRNLESADFVPNPFARSVVFNNLSCSISASLLHLIADNFGSSIENIAFCSNHWEFLMHFTDLPEIDDSFEYMAKKCTSLKSFICCLKLPSSAVLSLVHNSRTLKHVHVYKKNLLLSGQHKPFEKFQEILLAERPCCWKMLDEGENIYQIPRLDSILFDNCYEEFI